MEASNEDSRIIKYAPHTMTVLEPYYPDIFTAYGLSMSGLVPEDISRIIDDISRNKQTFPCLYEVLNSNRHPYTIMVIGAKMGMYIPPRKRTGLDAYNFFLNNIRHYEATFQRADQPIPSIYEIYMSKDRSGLLMKFRDDEILKSGTKFSRNYNTRKEMIDKFIENNIAIHGQFSLDANSRSVYASKAHVIVYVEPNYKTSYSTESLSLLFDMKRGMVWKNRQFQQTFSRYSLHHLRQQILEKFEQWRHRDGTVQINGPAGLYNILVALENILVNDIRNDAGAYLGNPSLN